MPYTNTWDNNDPPNNQAANTAAAEMRQTKLDIYERLITVFTNLTANPLALNATFITYLNSVLSTGFPLNTDNHWSSGTLGGDNDLTVVDFVTGAGAYIQPIWDGIGATTLHWIMPVSLPTARTFTGCAARVYRDAGAGVTLTLYKTTNTGSVTTVATAASASTGWQSLTLALGGTITITAGFTYWMDVTLVTDPTGAFQARLMHTTLS